MRGPSGKAAAFVSLQVNWYPAPSSRSAALTHGTRIQRRLNACKTICLCLYGCMPLDQQPTQRVLKLGPLLQPLFGVHRAWKHDFAKLHRRILRCKKPHPRTNATKSLAIAPGQCMLEAVKILSLDGGACDFASRRRFKRQVHQHPLEATSSPFITKVPCLAFAMACAWHTNLVAQSSPKPPATPSLKLARQMRWRAFR